MDRKTIKAYYIVTVLLLAGSVKSKTDKVLSLDVTKTQTLRHEHMLEQMYEKSTQVDLKFSQSPFMYTTEMTFGSNN